MPNVTPFRPTYEHFRWAKLLTPRDMPPQEDWASADWEVAFIFDNNGEGDEAYMVSFPGIGPAQRIEDCVFGPEVEKPKELE